MAQICLKTPEKKTKQNKNKKKTMVLLEKNGFPKQQQQWPPRIRLSPRKGYFGIKITPQNYTPDQRLNGTLII